MLARLTAYLRGLARRREIDAETDDELQFHLDRQIETNLGHGMSAAEARRLALRDLGRLTQTREAVRAVRTTWLDSVWYDTRHAVRSLRRSPAFTAVALLSLALGIGANTAMFSIVNSLMLRALPVERPDRLVLLLSNPSVNPSSPWSNPGLGADPRPPCRSVPDGVRVLAADDSIQSGTGWTDRFRRRRLRERPVLRRAAACRRCSAGRSPPRTIAAAAGRTDRSQSSATRSGSGGSAARRMSSAGRRRSIACRSRSWA